MEIKEGRLPDNIYFETWMMYGCRGLALWSGFVVIGIDATENLSKSSIINPTDDMPTVPGVYYKFYVTTCV